MLKTKPPRYFHLQAVKTCRGDFRQGAVIRCLFQKSSSGRKQRGIVIIQRGYWRKEVTLIVPGIMRRPEPLSAVGLEKEAGFQRDFVDKAPCQGRVEDNPLGLEN